MGFFFGATFWGLLILLFGLSILMREVFHVHIPFVRIFIGIMFVYFGCRIIAGGFWRHSGWYGGNNAVFGNANMQYESGVSDYSVVFGNGIVDLTSINTVTANQRINVDVVFGNGTVKLNDSIPAKVELSTAFGSAVTPDRTINALGKSYYTTPAYRDGAPYLFVKADVVFGRLVIQTGSGSNWR
jgi:hypothetical protein